MFYLWTRIENALDFLKACNLFLLLSNYNRDTVFSHNIFYRLGDNGIVLVGGTQLLDGTQRNQPRGVQILYNLLFENGIWGKQVNDSHFEIIVTVVVIIIVNHQK